MLLMKILASFMVIASLTLGASLADMIAPRGLAVAQITSVLPPGTLPVCTTNPVAPTVLTFRRCCIIDSGSRFCGDSSNVAIAAGSTGDNLTDNFISDLLNVDVSSNAGDDQVMIGNGTVYRGVTLPSCSDVTEKLSYQNATNTWSCETDGDNITNDDLADLNNVNADVIPTDDFMIIGNGTSFRGVSLLGCNATTEKLIYTTATNSFSCETDGGGGGTQGTLDDAFDAGNVIDGAACETAPIRITRGGDDFWDICIDASGVPSLIATCNGAACDAIQNIPSGKAAIQQGDGTEFERVTSGGVHTYSAVRRPTHSFQWSAGSMFGDGTECDVNPTDETINSTPSQGMRCPMSTAETDGFIYGLPIELPGNFEKSLDVFFNIRAYLIVDDGAGTWHGAMSIDCVGEGETPGTYGTEIGLDLAPAGADNVNDEVHDIGDGVIDTDTSGANCNPGDTLYWRWRSCDTDATPSANCTSSAGFETDMSIFNVRMEYRTNSETE